MNDKVKVLNQLAKLQNSNSLKQLARMETGTRILYRIRKITNELKSNCAYSTKNMETEMFNLDKVNAPEREINLLKRTWDLKHNVAELLFDELETFLDSVT